MKRAITVFLSVLMLTVTGCAGKPSAGFSEGDLVLTVNDSAYHCRDNINTVIERLGDGYEYAEGRSCDYDGLDKTYTYEAATFYTNPLAEGDLLNEIYSDSESVVTSKGLSVGKAKADVLAAYGEPREQDATLFIYRASDEIGAASLCFEFEGDTVSAIFLTMEQV